MRDFGAWDRRSFLKGMAAGAAFAVAGLESTIGADAAQAEGKRKFTKALVCGSISVKASQLEAISLAEAHGFESVEPSAGYLGGLSDAQLQELLADLKMKGLVWSSAGLPVDFRGEEDRFRQGLPGLASEAAVLQKAGVTRMGTWIRPSHDTLTYRANFDQHARRLKEVAKILNDHRIRLGLEYVGPKTSWTSGRHSFVHTLAEDLELIDAIGAKNVGVVLDSWHWYTAGESVEDLKALKNEQVVACDLNDAPAGLQRDEQKDSARKLPCATGVIDVKAFLEALVSIGYDGPIRAEPFDADLKKLSAEDAVSATSKAMDKAFALLG